MTPEAGSETSPGGRGVSGVPPYAGSIVRLFRVVRNDPPKEDDFRTAWERGRRPNSAAAGASYARDVENLKGLSMLRSLEAARTYASRFRRLGDYIAEVEVPDDLRVTNGGDHVNVYGRSAKLAPGWVVATVLARVKEK